MSESRKFLYTMAISLIIVKIISVIFNKIVTAVLPKDEFSLYIIVINAVVMISGISALGMTKSLMRYLIHYESKNMKKETRELLTTTLFYTNAFQAIVLTLLFIGANFGFVLFQANNYNYLILLIAVSSYIQLSIAFLMVVANSRFDSLGYFSLLVFPQFLFLGFTILQVLGGSMESISLIYANITANGIVMITLLSRLLVTDGLGKISLKVFKDSIKFVGPLLIVGQFVTISQYFFLALLFFFYPGEVAVYAIALSIANILQLIRQAIPSTYEPLVIKYYEAGRYDYLNYFVNKSLKLYLIFAVPFLLVIYAFSPFLIELLSTKEYLSGTILVLFLSATNLIQTGKYLTSFGYMIMMKTKQLAFVNIFALIVKIIIAIILIPEMGIVGLGLTILINDAIVVVGEFIVSQNLYKIHYQHSIHARISFLTLITLILAFLLYYSLQLSFEFSLIISAIFFIVCVLLFKIFTLDDFNFMKFVFLNRKSGQLPLE
jgi:O-antigen/teichoic acid export membrane protein